VRELEGQDEVPPGYIVSQDGNEIPTGEELGSEFERFLAERARRVVGDDPPA
jgi:hypothetical protein